MHPNPAQSDHAEVEAASERESDRESERGGSERASESGGIEAALAGLETVGERPLSEHAEFYEHVHTRLQAALSEIDSA